MKPIIPFETFLKDKMHFESQSKTDIIKTQFSSEILDTVEEYINYGKLKICDSFRDERRQSVDIQ